jgi:hypothetical protein
MSDFFCQYCGKPFNRKFNLQRHNNICRLKKKSKCKTKEKKVIKLIVDLIENDILKNKNEIIYENIEKELEIFINKNIINLLIRLNDISFLFSEELINYIKIDSFYPYRFLNLLKIKNKNSYSILIKEFKENSKLFKWIQRNDSVNISILLLKIIKRFEYLSNIWIYT